MSGFASNSHPSTNLEAASCSVRKAGAPPRADETPALDDKQACHLIVTSAANRQALRERCANSEARDVP